MLCRQPPRERTGKGIAGMFGDRPDIDRIAARGGGGRQACLLHILECDAAARACPLDLAYIHAMIPREGAGHRADVQTVRNRRCGRRGRGGRCIGRRFLRFDGRLGITALVRCDEAVHLAVGRRVICGRQHGDQVADFVGFALLRDQAGKLPIGLGLHFVGDLGSFDELQQITLPERLPLGDLPFGDDALCHFNAPFGHGECAQIGHDAHPLR